MNKDKKIMKFSGEFGEKVQRVNDFLKEYEPNNWGKDHKSYSGYKPQWIIDAVNQEFCGDWTLEVIDSEIHIAKKEIVTKVKDSAGVVTENVKIKETENALVRVRLTLNGVSIDTFASHPNVQGDIGDTFKSAQTDAMKKAFAHFSIGNRAYHGLLK